MQSEGAASARSAKLTQFTDCGVGTLLERRMARGRSELVFILVPIVIPLVLAIGIAAPYIADSRFSKRLSSKQSSGARSLPASIRSRYDS